MINVVELTKKYVSGKNEVIALDGVSLSVKKGEFIAIVGESGAGKSTLFHLMAGVDSATSGQIFIDGKDILSMNKNALTKYRRDKIGLVYQFYNLVSVLTIEENIVLPKRLKGEKLDKDKLNAVLEQFNLLDRRNHLPNELSGGQQQRAAIARVIYSEPSIILADEPTGNLDQKNSNEVLKYLQMLNKSFNQTIIMITHSSTIAGYADRIIELSDGRIKSDEVNNNEMSV